MPAPQPSNLDFEQCIRGAYDDATGTLRTSTNITGPIDMSGDVIVDIRAEDGDSVKVAGTQDGTSGGTLQYLKINPDGSIDVNASLTVTSVDQGDPNTIANAWPVLITDGTNSASVNADGSINVANVSSDVSDTATLSTITSSLLSQVVLASNVGRKGFILVNDSSEVCKIAFAATTTTSSYTISLSPGGQYQNEAIIYTGVISCIWDIANGSLKVTELT